MAEVFYFHVQEDRSIKYKLHEPIMQEDKDVAVWCFRIPKVLNNIDMSAWAWWFVYVNAKNQKFSELLTLTNDIDDPDNYCMADYPIGYGISKTPGGFTFALEAINAEQGGEIDGEWHTRTYTHTVTPTLQGNQAEYAETESDIISALLEEVRTKMNQIIGGATPTPVASVSQMTDTSKLYLLTTDGEWYYYNGTAWVSGGVYGAGVVDSVPTQGSTNAVSSGGVWDEITDLKEELSYAVDTVHTEQSTDILPNITWTEGYYVAPNGVINTSSTNKYSNKIPVQEGDIITLLPSESAFRWICAYSGDTAVADSGTQNVSSYTVPSGIDGLVLTAYISSRYAPTAVYQKREITEYINVNDAEIEDISNRLESIEEVIKTESYADDVAENIIPSMTGGAITTTGATVAYQDFEYTQKIAVTEGALIEALSNGASVNIRFLCAYNGNVAMSESGSSTDIPKYTVPSGIDGIIVTVRKANNVDTIRVTTPTEKVGAYVKPIPLGFMAESGSLSSGDKLTLPYMQVKLYNRIVFNANVSNFSSIFYSMGAVKVEVDSTNLLITNGSGTALTPVPHGLTIGKNITLIIENETEEYISHVRICSDGEVFDYTSKFFAPSVNAAQYVQSNGSTLTECVLSWVSQNINAPIWVFGDSYLSLYDVRWTYYLIQDGYTKNVMLNGYAGQASVTDYDALVNLLETTTPKMVVWCLGMNDPDTTDAVNESWKTIYDKVIERQKEYGFELVLYTVPTTPTMNNRFKDAIIRESGYRYIEADKAVRINDNGDWISGTLNSDNVHPTETGAKVLYNRILADLPEIMCNR